MTSINPNDYFSPGRALSEATDLFVGREPQFAEALRLVAREGSSIAIFGQRGIGKTSFAWQLKEISQFRHSSEKRFIRYFRTPKRLAQKNLPRALFTSIQNISSQFSVLLAGTLT